MGDPYLELARTTVDSLADAAVLLDQELRAVHFNAAYIKLIGLRVSQVTRHLEGGGSAFELVGQSPTEDRYQAGQCLAHGRAIHLAEVEIRSAAGSCLVMLQSFLPVVAPEGRCSGVIEAFRDMSSEARIHHEYKKLLAMHKARQEELERKVTERTLQLTQALEEVTRLSRIDPLTGLLNRRSFQEFAEQAFHIAQRHCRCLALLMGDLDNFKRLNDTFGHQAGDTILSAAAGCLERAVRKSDRVARFGGEEFIILLTETQPEAVLDVARRCVKLVRELQMAALVPGKPEPQTISIGCATFPEHGGNLEELVARADEALYRAKQEGKDRAVLFTPAPEPIAEPVVRQAQQHRPRALVVAAERERVNAYREILGRTYDVVASVAGTRALTYCARGAFDVIVADEDVATENGVDFLRKTVPFLPSALRILILTNPDAYLTIRGANSACVDHFILRAESQDHLLGAVEQGLLRRSLAAQQPLSRAQEADSSQAMIEAMEEVLDRHALRYFYQPIVKVPDFVPFAFEALCRPQPACFRNPQLLFDTALEAGTLWVLGRMVRELIVSEIPKLPGEALVFINLHPADVGDQQLLQGEAFMRPWAERVVFEITERTAIPDTGAFKDNVEELRRHGFRIAVDDLGAGYASLNSVALLRPDFVKINMSLVRKIHESTIKQRLVRNIVNFANDEGIRVVAEGVETIKEATVVMEMGCHLLQGYYFGKPEPLA